MKEIRSKAKSNAGAARDRGLSVFGLGAVFVDERTVLQLSPADAEAGVNELSSTFSDGGEDGDTIPLHVVPTECVFDNDNIPHIKASDNNTGNGELNGKQDVVGDRERNLSTLFHGVKDATGREDLLEYLRMQAIQKVTQDTQLLRIVVMKDEHTIPSPSLSLSLSHFSIP